MYRGSKTGFDYEEIIFSEMMEWSKEKTLKLIELLQMNASLWNPAACDSRRDKQKRKEELRHIAKAFAITVGDVTKKIQHLRTQYNREAAREARVKAEDPSDRYVSNWYAFEYLHFLKDSSKPFRVILSAEDYGDELVNALQTGGIDLPEDKSSPRTPPCKHPRLDCSIPKPDAQARDEFAVFGEYVANELRSLKGEKNLLVAKKKIQDAIFMVKMESMHQEPPPPHPPPPPLHSAPQHPAPQHSSHAHAPGMSEITGIINNCHYSNFKVDQQ